MLRVALERKVRPDGSVRSRHFLAIELRNQDRVFRAIPQPRPGGRWTYFDEDGRSLHGAFLRYPVPYRITSRFTRRRYHPILRRYRSHEGIDYGAPPGTPVEATASGVVARAGYAGGYGRVVELRHAQGIRTRYAHLSAIGAGIRPGARVEQGTVIGRVGSSGLATGPHLHYEFIMNGRHRDPLTVELPGRPALATSRLAEFRRTRDQALPLLQGIPGPARSQRRAGRALRAPPAAPPEGVTPSRSAGSRRDVAQAVGGGQTQEGDASDDEDRHPHGGGGRLGLSALNQRAESGLAVLGDGGETGMGLGGVIPDGAGVAGVSDVAGIVTGVPRETAELERDGARRAVVLVVPAGLTAAGAGLAAGGCTAAAGAPRGAAAAPTDGCGAGLAGGAPSGFTAGAIPACATGCPSVEALVGPTSSGTFIRLQAASPVAANARTTATRPAVAPIFRWRSWRSVMVTGSSGWSSLSCFVCFSRSAHRSSHRLL